MKKSMRDFMRRCICFVLVAVMLLPVTFAAGVAVTGYEGGEVSAATGSEKTTTAAADDGTAKASAVRWQDYIGKRIGVLTGTLMEDAATKYFPGSEYLYFNNYPDLNAALLTGKIDAYLGDEPGAKTIHAEQPQIDYIKDRITDQNYAFAFRKDDPESKALCDEFNDYLKKIKENGVFEELDNIWLGIDEDKKVVDMSGLKDVNGTIKVITTSTDMPWSYIKDGKNAGYDIDLIARFCKDRGYALEIGDVDYPGRIPAVQSGKYDFSTDMNVTPEREEEVLFSEPTYTGGIVLTVLSEDLTKGNSTDTSEDGNSSEGSSAAPVPEYTTFDELNGKTISMITGAPFEELISSKVSDVKEFTYYQTMPDMMLGIKNGNTDAGLMNNAVATLAVNRDNKIAIFPQSLGDSYFGIGFKKGSEICTAWQEAYKNISDDTKKALWEKWTGADMSVKTLPEQDWPGTNGTVNVAACDSLEPMSYVGEDGKVLGLDIETILLIAKELDVHVNFTPMDFSAVLSSISSGKTDMGVGSIVISDERRESMDFVEYQPASFVLIVRSKGAEAKELSFWDSIKGSFNKTFVREKRYLLFIQGVLTTILITVLSIIFGTALGFLVYLLCRRGGKVSNKISGFFVWLIQGMPVVVLLMILYYIIFAKSDISGSAVAVVAFTLVFGAAVFGMLKMGVGAVDKGQTEAALSLGYSDTKAFFRIILPQALPHFLPSYKGEVVALIKATAIVGYIAVQDLTKMGDIVRGRTYEAFFPLIVVAIIYFILGALLTFLVGRLEKLINPKRRNAVKILKGVKTDD